MPRSSSGRTSSGSPARRRLPPGPPGGSGGFSLLEVIVALAVVGLGVGVVFSGIGQALRVRRDAAEDLALTVVADGLVGGLLARGKAPEETEEGEEGGVRWRLEPVGLAAPTGGDTTPPPLVEVHLTLEGPGGRPWRIVTLLPREEAKRP